MADDKKMRVFSEDAKRLREFQLREKQYRNEHPELDLSWGNARKIKYPCVCGGRYTIHHRSMHASSKKHREFMGIPELSNADKKALKERNKDIYGALYGKNSQLPEDYNKAMEKHYGDTQPHIINKKQELTPMEKACIQAANESWDWIQEHVWESTKAPPAKPVKHKHKLVKQEEQTAKPVKHKHRHKWVKKERQVMVSRMCSNCCYVQLRKKAQKSAFCSCSHGEETQIYYECTGCHREKEKRGDHWRYSPPRFIHPTEYKVQ